MGLFDIEGERPDADPFVIALAVARQRSQGPLRATQYLVVSDEGRVNFSTRPRIPDVCRDPAYQIECVRTLELFRREEWRF
ncbi:MAG: DUF4411 family protein [Chloroflexi bacterium]|nr:DUF4411 family protein [Chloroflexota bacterium]